MTITFHQQTIVLDKDRAIFLPEHNLLAISDLHLGKSAHFRKEGIQVPTTIASDDLNRLEALLHRYKPAKLLINGDMFHHKMNLEVEQFGEWRQGFKQVEFLLVKGNHDRLSEASYAHLDIKVHDPHYCLGPFCFIHDAPACTEKELYPIIGHIHPGVSMVGKAKQSLKFPCFFFGEKYAVLPAFSYFTGLSLIKPLKTERIFAITPTNIVAL